MNRSYSLHIHQTQISLIRFFPLEIKAIHIMSHLRI